MQIKERGITICHKLDEAYKNAPLALKFANPFQLLVATILSAQCTDERVNQVTAKLFKKYPDAHELSQANISTLEQDIKPTGFFRNKAKSLIGCASVLVDRHDGTVPSDLDALVKLPGVGRKTANVVLAGAFGIPGIIVDTHVSRVSRRLGLTKNKDAVKIEFDLMGIIPKDRWSLFSRQLILHGRAVCAARKPRCETCFVSELCDYFQENMEK